MKRYVLYKNNFYFKGYEDNLLSFTSEQEEAKKYNWLSSAYHCITKDFNRKLVK